MEAKSDDYVTRVDLRLGVKLKENNGLGIVCDGKTLGGAKEGRGKSIMSDGSRWEIGTLRFGGRVSWGLTPF